MLDSVCNFIDLFFVGCCACLLVRDWDDSIWFKFLNCGLTGYFVYMAFFAGGNL
jgi:hypothetical protein